MKKTMYILMALSIILMLAACGQGNNDENDHSTPIEDSENNQSENDKNGENKAPSNNENSNTEQNDHDANSNEGNNNNKENANNDADEVETIDNLSLFFSDDQLMEIYRVNTGEMVTADEAGAKEAYDMWLNGPEASNLVGLLPETTAVESVEFKNDLAYVSFNKAILDANLGSTGEAMLTEQIAAIASQFGYMKTQILIEGEIVESFLGHMTISEPIAVPDINQFKVAQ